MINDSLTKKDFYQLLLLATRCSKITWSEWAALDPKSQYIIDENNWATLAKDFRNSIGKSPSSIGKLVRRELKQYGRTDSIDECIFIASLFETERDWRKSEPTSFQMADMNGWRRRSTQERNKRLIFKTTTRQDSPIQNISSNPSDLKLNAKAEELKSQLESLKLKRVYLESVRGDLIEQALDLRNENVSKKKDLCVFRNAYISKKMRFDYPADDINQEYCMSESARHKTFTQWMDSSPLTVEYAKKRGFLKCCTSHMLQGVNPIEIDEKDVMTDLDNLHQYVDSHEFVCNHNHMPTWDFQSAQ